MDGLKTRRRFEQRFLDHPDRHVREESQKLRKRGISFKRRYATMILGASLAMGGLGIPMKMKLSPQTDMPQAQQATTGVMSQLTTDLQTAQSIAREVTSGVELAAETIAKPVTEPLKAVDQDLKLVTEKVKEDFFKKEIPFGSIIYKEAKKNNLKPELVAAVVKNESRFKPNARSHVGAQGLMQLMPKTGRWMGAKNLMDPTQNIQAGTKYLKYLNERFDGNETKVIAAYNAGEGNVRRFGGVPPFKETRNYYKKVTSSTAEYEDQIASRIAELSESPAESEVGEALR